MITAKELADKLNGRLAVGRTNGIMRKPQTYIRLKRGLRQRMLWF